MVREEARKIIIINLNISVFLLFLEHLQVNEELSKTCLRHGHFVPNNHAGISPEQRVMSATFM